VAIPSRAAVVAVALLVLLAVTSCDGKEDRDSSVGRSSVHADGDGPLSASMPGSGGVTLNQPRHIPWYASFGTPLLCVTQDAEATIENVRYHEQIAPESTDTWLRQLPPARPGAASDTLPIQSKLGAAPFTDPGPNWLAGTWRHDLHGATVTTPCASAERKYELVTTMHVATEGALLDHIYVDYSVAGKAYTLRLDWSYVGCGTQTRSICLQTMR
jgi:hypothetical protein